MDSLLRVSFTGTAGLLQETATAIKILAGVHALPNPLVALQGLGRCYTHDCEVSAPKFPGSGRADRDGKLQTYSEGGWNT